MKILKSNTKEVFDTDDVNFKEYHKDQEPNISKTLHWNHELTDYEFLSKYFPRDHSIFNEFSKSFYFIV